MDGLNPDLSHTVFLKLAADDAESAKILYSNTKYSQAVYFFQQSVEKTCKYLGLTIKAISVNKLRKISHNPHLVFKSIFTDSVMIETGLIQDFNYFEAAFNSMIDKEKILYVEKQLKGAYQTDAITIQPNETNAEALVRYYRQIPFCKDLAQTLEDEINKSQSIMPIVNKMAAQTIRQINDMSISVTCEMILSFVVWGIEANSRYPDYETNTIPQELYSQNSTLVKYLPIFMQFHQIALQNIKEYYIKNNED